MDSPKIAIHFIIQNKFSSVIQDAANKLYCSRSQPIGCNQNITSNININNNKTRLRSVCNSTSTSDSTASSSTHRLTKTSSGMLANANASNNNSNTSQPQSTSSSSSTNRQQNQQDGNTSKNDEMTNNSVLRNQNIRKMGWYWGSISPEYATRLLKDEPDGSFLIRDSSNDCYIFSMTLKLENEVHHARIEHSSGYFSFGRSRKFYCTTIVEFIEQAIESSRNGDLLFFLHRDPEMMGPVEFRMTPLSRMNGSNSLKHLCRFAILPYVRKSKINELCLPESLKDYLHEPFKSNGH